MMGDVIISPYSIMRASISSVIKTRDSMRSDLVKQAEMHHAKLERDRMSAQHKASINEGIARQHR